MFVKSVWQYIISSMETLCRVWWTGISSGRPAMAVVSFDLRRVRPLRSSCFSGRCALRGLLAILACFLASISSLQAATLSTPASSKSVDVPKAAAADVRTTTESVTGEVSGISSGVISVTYKKAAGQDFDMLLPVDKTTRFEHVRTLKELLPGDTIQVQYEQTYTDGQHGERVILKTLATSVAFVKHGTQEALRSTEQKAP